MANLGGRPTKYREKYCRMIIEYFDQPAIIVDEEGHEKANDIPLIEGFARSIKVCVDTLYEWEKVHPRFSEALKRARECQKDIWQQLSMKGLVNTAYSIFWGKNIFKWTDKQDIDLNAKVDSSEGLSSTEREVLKQLAREKAATI